MELRGLLCSRADVLTSSCTVRARKQFALFANHLRRFSEQTRGRYVLFEDRVCSVNFNE
jgi:hypothetical protein